MQDRINDYQEYSVGNWKLLESESRIYYK